MSTRVEPDTKHGSPTGENSDTTETELLTGATPSRVRLRGPANGVRSVCGPFWADRRIGVAAVVAAAASWGLVAGWWTPRSPLTTSQAIWSITISVFVGGVGGLMMRSRWALLVGPLVFAVVFELTRLGTDGPTVDMPAFSTYGILALVVGRVFHALISLAPIAFGAVLGAGVARHLDDTTARGHQSRRWALRARRGVATLAAVGLVGFTVLLARPASTDHIVDADGNRVPGSIAELSTIDVNGHDLDVMIRGHSVDNRVLLFLAGGPGGAEMGAMRNHLPGLEEHFTVVTWDQRGTGKAYDELDPTDSYTLDSVVDDTIAVTNHLRDRFGQDRIYLLGQSWGSTLGVLAVQQHPELYTALIGTGQMVSQFATDTIFYNDTLEWAQATGDNGLVADLVAIGPPPYDRMLDYETALSSEHEIYPYDHSANSEGEGGFSENFFVSEYTLTEQVHLLGAFMDTFSVMYPQLQDIDFRQTATEFEIPVFFVQGAHEADGRADVFTDWYPMINAPIKDVVVLDTSGHRPLFEQPDEFTDYMVAVVLGQTSE
jgi:pimeloyl-ACP methyl ester carboxylesterase/phage tail protein X